SGRTAPPRIRTSVDLPAPFSPTSAWISPASTSKSTPSSAVVARKRLRIVCAPAATSFMRNCSRCATVLRSRKTGQCSLLAAAVESVAAWQRRPSGVYCRHAGAHSRCHVGARLRVPPMVRWRWGLRGCETKARKEPLARLAGSFRNEREDVRATSVAELTMGRMTATGARSIPRRPLLKAGLALPAGATAAPFPIRARAETPVKIGIVEPLTGVYAGLAESEVAGAQFAVEQVNQSGG